MRFGYTIIYVPDVEKTVQFYKDAFQLKSLFIHESKQYAELDTGETKLSFASEGMAEMNKIDIVKNDNQNTAPGFEIALISENVEKAYQLACDKGATPIHPPTEKPWGQTVAYVRDINGILVEMCTALS